MTNQETKIQRAMTQDYWLQVMTYQQRTEVMAAIGFSQDGETIRQYHNRCMDYIIDTNLEAVLNHQSRLEEIMNS